jgi:DNA-binding GntR family transcriptional regulator
MSAKREALSPFDFLVDPPGEEARQKGQLFGTTTSVIRSLIITGILAPGARVRERELCEQLGVSRTPVREAIKTLTQEGFVQALPNRSAVVTPLNLAEIGSLIVVLATIEGLAGRLACGTATDEQIAGIALLQERMNHHHLQDDLPNYFAANKQFHRKIVEAAENSVLLAVWDMLALRVDRARYASNLWPQRWPEAIREHQIMVETLRRRDGEALSEQMNRHVHNGLSVLAGQRPPARPVAKPDAEQGPEKPKRAGPRLPSRA